MIKHNHIDAAMRIHSKGSVNIHGVYKMKMQKTGRVLMEALRDRAVSRVHLQREVGREHDGRVALGRVVRVGHLVRGRAVLRDPLRGARGALGLLPLVREHVVEVPARKKIIKAIVNKW